MKFNKINIYNYSIILISAFPLLGLKRSTVTIFIFSIISLFVFFSNKSYKNTTKKDLINIFILSLYFIAYFVSFLFSSDKTITSKLLEQNLSFLIFPLFLVLNQQLIFRSTLNKALNVFAISNIILALYIWAIILNKGVLEVFKQNTYYNPIIRNLFNDASGIHLPYLGLFYVYSSFILINEILNSWKKTIFLNFLRIVGVIILMISVIIFAARAALIIFGIIFIFIVFKRVNDLKTKLALILIFLGVFLLLLKLPPIENRIKQFTNAKLILPSKGQSSENVNFRYGIYKCVFSILKENWLFGVGVNNVQSKLDECYSSYTYENFDDFKHISYNSHNQYLDVCLKYGILGVLIFLIFLFWGIKNNNINFQIFLFLILMSMISENIFNRQVGIVFFNFFNSLFFISMFKNQKDKNEKSLNT